MKRYIRHGISLAVGAVSAIVYSDFKLVIFYCIGVVVGGILIDKDNK